MEAGRAASISSGLPPVGSHRAPWATSSTSRRMTRTAVAVRGTASVTQKTMASRKIANIRSPGASRFGISTMKGTKKAAIPRTRPTFWTGFNPGAVPRPVLPRSARPAPARSARPVRARSARPAPARSARPAPARSARPARARSARPVLACPAPARRALLSRDCCLSDCLSCVGRVAPVCTGVPEDFCGGDEFVAPSSEGLICLRIRPQFSRGVGPKANARSEDKGILEEALILRVGRTGIWEQEQTRPGYG